MIAGRNKKHNKETGLDYFGARYYSSRLYRWTSVDPIRIKKRAFYDPQDWNLYVYCGNNPVKNIDPDGKIFKSSSKWINARVQFALMFSPTAREMYSVIDSDSRTFEYKEVKLNNRFEMERVRTQGGTIKYTFGMKLTDDKNIIKDPKDIKRSYSRGEVFGIDRQVVEKNHPTDKSGITTIFHEMLHNISFCKTGPKGLTYVQAQQEAIRQEGDSTNGTTSGEAERVGTKVFLEAVQNFVMSVLSWMK